MTLKELGNTRSCQRPNHLLLTPDTFVRAPLPGMTKGVAIVHASPHLGARFTHYTAELEKDGALGDTSQQRFIYVLEGSLSVVDKCLTAGEFVFFPTGTPHTAVAQEPTRAVVIEKPYQALVGIAAPGVLIGGINLSTPQPLLGDTSVQVRPLIPDSPQFDFAVNSMTFEPGGSLPMVESHVMEHGLLMIAGGGIYRLGDCWHSVTNGDFIYMAPYCPQWFCAVGKTPAQYIIYKDWNRHAH
jgi:(S)-ureidoglycine aminohydrolase